jgi:hypothetical protein
MYSNGFKYTEVITALLGRLGWRQGTLSGVPTLSAANLASTSGRYFNDFHSLVTIKNIKDTIEDVDIVDADFNTYLESLQESVISETLNRIFTPQFYDEPKLIFDRHDSTETTQANSGLFVGYKLRPAADNDVTVQINSLSLLFDGAATFNIYLFHEKKATALKTQSVTTIANEQVKVDLEDWYLSYLNGSTQGGSFYIGYFQDDLGSVKAINETADWNYNTFCFKYESAYCDVLSATTIDSDGYSGSVTNGLNLEVSSFRDYTNKILRNVSLLDNAMGYGMACKVLESIIYATNRSNANERALQSVIAEATYDLTGTLPVAGTSKKRSLRDDLNSALEVLHNQFFPNPKVTTINVC